MLWDKTKEKWKASNQLKSNPGHLAGATIALITMFCTAGNIPGRKFSRISILWLFMKVFSVKFGAWCPLAQDKRAIHECFFPQKSYFSPICKSFLFPATRYWATRPRKLPALLIFYMYGTGTWYKMLQSHTCQSLTRTISPSSSGLAHSLNIMSLWHSHD